MTKDGKCLDCGLEFGDVGCLQCPEYQNNVQVRIAMDGGVDNVAKQMSEAIPTTPDEKWGYAEKVEREIRVRELKQQEESAELLGDDDDDEEPTGDLDEDDEQSDNVIVR